MCFIFISLWFLLALKNEPIINFRHYLLIHLRSRRGCWMLSWRSLARPVPESKAMIRCDISAWRPLGSWTGKQRRWQSVSNAPKPEESLAAETSHFMLVSSPHSTSSFLMCISLTVILFYYLHGEENTGPDLHFLGFFKVISIIDFWSTTAFTEWIDLKLL